MWYSDIHAWTKRPRRRQDACTFRQTERSTHGRIYFWRRCDCNLYSSYDHIKTAGYRDRQRQGGGRGEREMETETERQTDRQRQRRTGERRRRERDRDREGERETDRDRQTDRQTETETDRQTDRQRQTEFSFSSLQQRQKQLLRVRTGGWTFLRPVLCLTAWTRQRVHGDWSCPQSPFNSFTRAALVHQGAKNYPRLDAGA